MKSDRKKSKDKSISKGFNDYRQSSNTNKKEEYLDYIEEFFEQSKVEKVSLSPGDDRQRYNPGSYLKKEFSLNSDKHKFLAYFYRYKKLFVFLILILASILFLKDGLVFLGIIGLAALGIKFRFGKAIRVAIFLGLIYLSGGMD